MKDARRSRLLALFHSPRFRGDRAKLINETGLTKGRVAQLFDEDQPFGETAARRLAERLSLPKNFFEHDAMSGDTPIVLASTQDEASYAGQPAVRRLVPVVGEARLQIDGHYEELQYTSDQGYGTIEGYSSDPNAYALRVRGDGMHPAIRHGAFVVVEPNGRCVPGEYVALQLRDGRKMVKELVIERAEEVVVESVNGGARQTIPRAEIERMHPVAAVVAASKWRPAP